MKLKPTMSDFATMTRLMGVENCLTDNFQTAVVGCQTGDDGLVQNPIVNFKKKQHDGGWKLNCTCLSSRNIFNCTASKPALY